jgi:hypothetical protein
MDVSSTDTFTDYCPFPYSYRKSDIQHLISLTDSFTWEELPTRDPDTGHLTKAGYIPTMQNFAAYIITFGITYHTVHSTVLIVLNHDMPFTNWYPFDPSVSPIYEIAILTQVIVLTWYNCRKCSDYGGCVHTDAIIL